MDITVIKRILERLEERRSELKEDDRGFTLIELLVVVIIIGILVAIAIPVYIGLQNGAKDAAAQSDLTNAKIAVIAYYTEGGTAANIGTADLTSYGWVDSSSNANGPTISAPTTSSSTAFCISTVSEAGDTFAVSAAHAPAKGTCSGNTWTPPAVDPEDE
ncbi:prepilin-type N-terminal cleavage/methylation domain-containing protein [Agromyces protaetiae]|uniref:Prepilin-type N-terminal cleavage/methylation domain-containing protein n=2 Tax=Agromyces protaetiae TaxID=2509455 RepID=A0A4P6FFZ5_9MICO|nr:prepilin-type N-terminal cleavage/methylation domain-containing protein [Agromyces protaetiae]